MNGDGCRFERPTALANHSPGGIGSGHTRIPGDEAVELYQHHRAIAERKQRLVEFVIACTIGHPCILIFGAMLRAVRRQKSGHGSSK